MRPQVAMRLRPAVVGHQAKEAKEGRQAQGGAPGPGGARPRNGPASPNFT